MNAYAAVEDHEAERREAIRYPVVASGRMTWTDAPGDDRSASIRTENVSERGVLLECLSTTEISPYRLVSRSRAARDRAKGSSALTLSPRSTTCAPNARVRRTLVKGVPCGMMIVAGIPSRRA